MRCSNFVFSIIKYIRRNSFITKQLRFSSFYLTVRNSAVESVELRCYQFFIKFSSFFFFSFPSKRTILIKIPVIPLFLITTCIFLYAKYFVPLCENFFYLIFACTIQKDGIQRLVKVIITHICCKSNFQYQFPTDSFQINIFK